MILPEPDPPEKADPVVDLADSILGIPRRLGNFRIVHEVGRGGMGVVFEAEDQTLGRRVALKVLPVAATLEPEQVARFQLEAQVVARLAHPNILPVYSVGHDQGISFFAMPLVIGTNLAEIIHEMARSRPLAAAAGPSSSGEVAAASTATSSEAGSFLVDLARDSARPGEFCRAVGLLGRQAALALAHSHEAGVWHRDIKPANLLVEPGGHLWVTDFGLARLADNPGLTRPGDRAGTVRYMSPEQLAGDRNLVDGRSDIYSLGMTLHEVLHRRTAPAGGWPARSTRAVRAEPVPAPLRRTNPSIPVDLETIIIRATAHRPDDRYATASDLAEDLRRFLDGEPILARRLGIPERFRRWSSRPERFTEAAQSLFWFGVFLTVINLGSLAGYAFGYIRLRDASRLLIELGIGLIVFDLPTVACGVRALRGYRDGLVLGSLAVIHFLLLVLCSLAGSIVFNYGGIANDLSERWALEVILASLAGFTLSRLAVGIRAAWSDQTSGRGRRAISSGSTTGPGTNPPV